MGHQIITADDGHRQVKTCIIDKLRGCSGTGLGINPTGVGYQLDTLSSYVGQIRFQHRIDKVRSKTTVLISCAGSCHDRHRDLGKVIVNDVIQSAGCKQLGRGHSGFSPKAAGTTNPYGSLCHHTVNTAVNADCWRLSSRTGSVSNFKIVIRVPVLASNQRERYLGPVQFTDAAHI